MPRVAASERELPASQELPGHRVLQTLMAGAAVADVEAIAVTQDHMAFAHRECRHRPAQSRVGCDPSQLGAIKNLGLQGGIALLALQPIQLCRLRRSETPGNDGVKAVGGGRRIAHMQSGRDIYKLVVSIGGPAVQAAAEGAGDPEFIGIACQHAIVIAVVRDIRSQTSA